MTPTRTFSVDPNQCVGRDDACLRIVKQALDGGCVLLFGGRQAGKTMVLLRTQQLMRAPATAGAADVCVYSDLTGLGSGPTARTFFAYLVACARQLLGTTGRIPESWEPLCAQERCSDALSAFEADLAHLETLLQRDCALRWLFLVDEAKRIVGEPFSAGLLANLFSILFGTGRQLSGRVSFVFAGAQDLYAFCEDSCSPIGTRAAQELLSNLDRSDIEAMVARNGLATAVECADLAKRLWEQTGGHAGLCSFVVRRAESREREFPAQVIAEIQGLRRSQSLLFGIWNARLSPEARIAQAILAKWGRLDLPDLAARLRDEGLDAFRAERAMDELSFTGIGKPGGTGVTLPSSNVYLEYVKEHLRDEFPAYAMEAHHDIQAAELAMRQLVRERYDRRWGRRANERLAAAIGQPAWGRILENQAKGASQYPMSPGSGSSEVLDYCYFGQVAQAMMFREAWDLFRSIFKDKRQLEDMVNAISPLRNDIAHFRRAPQKETMRAQIASHDLLALFGRCEQQETCP